MTRFIVLKRNIKYVNDKKLQKISPLNLVLKANFFKKYVYKLYYEHF
jgi:hypothetical protein